jgi:mRNA interferase MazF
MPAARGEIWVADLNPTRGHEQAGRRPVLILSVDPFNKSPLDLVIIAPLTSKPKRIPTHVEVRPPEGGVTMPSWIKCEDIRSISTERLASRMGRVSPATMQAAERHLRALLGL